MRPCPLGGIEATACGASRGDKLSQLALAKAYENGTGVAQDFTRAAELYRAASSYSSGVTYIYSPAVGNARGQVIPVKTAPDQPGLPEADYRLGLMYRLGKGVDRDEKRALDLIERSVKRGYVPD